VPSRSAVCGICALILILVHGCSSGGIGMTGDPVQSPGDSGNGSAPIDESPGVTYGVIGTQGGEVTADDGSRVTFAAGALRQSTRITVRDVTSPPAMPGYTGVGAVKRLEPDGLGFGAAVALFLTVDEPPPGAVVRIIAYDASSGDWVEVPGAREAAGAVVVPIASLTLFAAAVREEGDPEGGRIVGVVTTGDGPLGEAKVEVTDGPNAEVAGRTALTGPAGGYELEGLPAGSYGLRATREGYNERVALGVSVTEGETSRCDFDLEAAQPEPGRIVGHVRNGEGDLLVEAKVEIVVGASRVGDFVYTDADGAYVIEELEPGTYALKASRTGYDSKTDDGITVSAGETAEHNFALTATEGGGDEPGSLRGVVRNQEGGAIAEATAEIVDGPSRVGDSTYTTSSGVFEFAELTPGTYAVKLTHESYNDLTEDGIAIEAGAQTNVELTMTAKEG